MKIHLLLGRLVFFVGLLVTASGVGAQAFDDTREDQRRLIGVAKETRLPEDYRAYLEAYPEGTYAAFARFELSLVQEDDDAPAKSDAPDS